MFNEILTNALTNDNEVTDQLKEQRLSFIENNPDKVKKLKKVIQLINNINSDINYSPTLNHIIDIHLVHDISLKSIVEAIKDGALFHRNQFNMKTSKE